MLVFFATTFLSHALQKDRKASAKKLVAQTRSTTPSASPARQFRLPTYEFRGLLKVGCS